MRIPVRHSSVRPTNLPIRQRAALSQTTRRALTDVARTGGIETAPRQPLRWAAAAGVSLSPLENRLAAMHVSAPVVQTPTTPVPGDSATPPPAWHRDVVYQIYPRSFFDASGDGVGDLRGILAKLDYLQALGVNTVWLSPIYKSPQYDNGYDISDYLDIDPRFGTLEDWDALRDGLHARGMKIVMDLVVNHSSSHHPWFVQEVRRKRLEHTLVQLRGAPDEAVAVPRAIAEFRAESAGPIPAGYPSLDEQLQHVANATSPCVLDRQAAAQDNIDFYLWREQPNNWTSQFGGPAWHSPEGTGIYYLAEFAPQQPDFNWTNPTLRSAIRGIVHTWIDRGIDGFRMDVIDFIAKDMAFPDAQGARPTDIGAGCNFYMDQPAVHDYLRELVQELRERGMVTVGETPGVSAEAATHYTNPTRQELDQVFLFDHMSVDRQNGRWGENHFDVRDLKRVYKEQQRTLHGRGWLGNYIENHDQVRVVSRYGNDGEYRVASAKMLATLLFTLEGTPYIYQGQEIGMTNARFRSEADLNDVEARNFYTAAVSAGADVSTVLDRISQRSRDNTRTPMQWTAGVNAGFSEGTPWLHVNDNHTRINVEQARADEQSPWYTYRDLIALRRESPTLLHGDFQLLWPDDLHLFAFTRTLGEETVTVLLNFSADTQVLPGALPNVVKKVFGTADTAALDAPLQPYEARILSSR